ncbi:MAG TPA: phosphopantetheine-binding protein [Thermoanaerobaculia bacterium]|jgi:acyl carrier protein|nr:phosphopantetheine-binding protein [Thermoanaerobaculia bacterium]
MADLEAALHHILRKRGYAGTLDATLPLGAGGLGLDSIAIVEVLLACEEQFGISVAAELLDGQPLTVGRLLGRIRGSA